jgi:hypothetical protein
MGCLCLAPNQHTIDQCVEDEFSVLLDQVVDVSEDSTATVSPAHRRYTLQTYHMMASPDYPEGLMSSAWKAEYEENPQGDGGNEGGEAQREMLADGGDEGCQGIN